MSILSDLSPVLTGRGAIESAKSQVSNIVSDYTQQLDSSLNSINTNINNAVDISNAISDFSTQQLDSLNIPDISNIASNLNIKADFFPKSFDGSLKSIVDIGNPFSQSQQDESLHSKYKVRLVSVLGLNTAFSSGDLNSVIFEVTPQFSESGNVEYTPVQPVHLPGGIQTYKYTHSRTFAISAKLISRNSADAIKNMKYLQTLRSWRYPFFGNSGTAELAPKNRNGAATDINRKIQQIKMSTTESNSSVELLGAPPEVLYLYAYSTSANDKRDPGNINNININRVPVVLTSLSITYPDDVDYIPASVSPTSKTEPFPIKIDVSINLVESHSPTEFERFNLKAYKEGKLTNF